MFKKNKLIAYLVKDATQKDKKSFLTIVKNKKEAQEFIMQWIKFQHLTHFKMWCGLQKRSWKENDSWLVYCKNVISPKEFKKYIVVKDKYSLDKFLAITRMFANCFPIGCSYELDEEFVYALKCFPEEKAKFEKELKELEKENEK